MRYRVRKLFSVIIFGFILTQFYGCGERGEEKLPIFSRPIGRISIQNREGKVRDITDTIDISFVMNQLSPLRRCSADSAANQFYLTFYYKDAQNPGKGRVTTLGMNQKSIGMSRADAGEPARWCFENDSLYKHIVEMF
jgi:hypothetical protein